MDKFCAECGTERQGDDRFCPECGTVFVTESALAQEPTDVPMATPVLVAETAQRPASAVQVKRNTLKDHVSAYAKGDKSAFDDIYSATYRKVYVTAHMYMKHQTDAEDVVQDVYIKFCNNVNSIQDYGKLIPWLVTLTRHTCLNKLKKQGREETTVGETNDASDSMFNKIEDERVGHSPESSFMKKEHSEIVLDLVASLPQEQKDAVILHYIEQRSISDIATITNVTSGTVKSRLNYARAKLKDMVMEKERQGVKLRSRGLILFLPFVLRYLAGITPLSAEVAEATLTAIKTAETLSSGTSIGTGIGTSVGTSIGSSSGTSIGTSVGTNNGSAPATGTPDTSMTESSASGQYRYPTGGSVGSSVGICTSASTATSATASNPLAAAVIAGATKTTVTAAAAVIVVICSAVIFIPAITNTDDYPGFIRETAPPRHDETAQATPSPALVYELPTVLPDESDVEETTYETSLVQEDGSTYNYVHEEESSVVAEEPAVVVETPAEPSRLGWWQDPSDSLWFYFLENRRSITWDIRSTGSSYGESVKATGWHHLLSNLRNHYFFFHTEATATAYGSRTGAMATGWLNHHGNYFWLHTNATRGLTFPEGAMAMDWHNIREVWYFFHTRETAATTGSPVGAMARNIELTIDGSTFVFDANGAWHEVQRGSSLVVGSPGATQDEPLQPPVGQSRTGGWIRGTDYWFFIDEIALAERGWSFNDDGVGYYISQVFNSGERERILLTGWLENEGRIHWLHTRETAAATGSPFGAMAENIELTIDGVVHTLGPNGEWVSSRLP